MGFIVGLKNSREAIRCQHIKRGHNARTNMAAQCPALSDENGRKGPET